MKFVNIDYVYIPQELDKAVEYNFKICKKGKPVDEPTKWDDNSYNCTHSHSKSMRIGPEVSKLNGSVH